MSNGFTFNGLHNSEYGVIMRSKNRMLLPGSRDQYEEVTGRDGSHLFSGALQDQLIELKCSLPETTLSGLNQKARQVAAWLRANGRAQLIFDDEPGLYYLGKVANQISLEQTLALGEFTIQFRCLPLAYSTVEKVIRWGLLETQTLIVANEGTYEAPPVITITALSGGMPQAVEVTGGWDPSDEMTALTNPTVTISGQTLRWVGVLNPDQSLVVDCEKMQAVKGGTNALGGITEGFPVLVPGSNSITLTDDTSRQGGILEIKFRERWL